MATDRLRLHLNENTAGCSPAVMDALRSLTPLDIATYPDYDAITERVARWFGVRSGQVRLTNGLDEGIHAVTSSAARATSGRSNFIQVDPSFEMFEEFTRMAGADLVRIAPEPDFAFPLERLLSRLTPETGVVYLVDPNNPTGLPLPPGAAHEVATAAPQALILVDEAYADFSGHTLIGPNLDRWPNLIVGRTFAKGHGLAGLRVGALVAHEATLDRLGQMLPPFNVNVAAVRALAAALDDDQHLRWYVEQAAESRRRIETFCRSHGLTFWPGVGNFLLVRVGPEAPAIARALGDRQIDVRDRSDAPGCAGCLRLTAGAVAHTDRLISAMEDILASRTN